MMSMKKNLLTITQMFCNCIQWYNIRDHDGKLIQTKNIEDCFLIKKEKKHQL